MKVKCKICNQINEWIHPFELQTGTDIELEKRNKDQFDQLMLHMSASHVDVLYNTIHSYFEAVD